MALLVAISLVGAAAFALHHHFSSDIGDARASALALIPADTDSVVFADITQLRTAPFFSALGDWVPQPQQVDAESRALVRSVQE